jgi:hypothetical protein
LRRVYQSDGKGDSTESASNAACTPLSRKARFLKVQLSYLRCGHCSVNEMSEQAPSRNTKHVAISTAHE